MRDLQINSKKSMNFLSNFLSNTPLAQNKLAWPGHSCFCFFLWAGLGLTELVRVGLDPAGPAWSLAQASDPTK